MKIAVYGAGGVGGYFGGLLARAGLDVALIARGEHLAAIQAKGLRVESVHGDFHVANIRATDDPQEVGMVDYVIVAVKGYHLAEVAPSVQPLVGPDTTVVPLLNGIDAHETLIKVLGPEIVVGGLCSVVSMIAAPGVIRQASRLQRIVVGELDHRPSDRVARLLAIWKDQGVDAVQAEDIHAALWTKFLFITSFSGIAALARATAGELRSDPETLSVLTEAFKEVERLAHARGIHLSPSVVLDTLKLVESFEPSATSSMQRDVEAGNLFELEAFSGTIVRLGRELDVPTPVHQAILGLLRPALRRAKALR